jgi:ubiquinone/menaquinone biosynthesis C-methylase UbiE
MSPQEHDIMRAVEDQYWWYQALRRHVVRSIDPGANDFALLDAGCGTGGMLAALREKFPSAKLTGIEISQHAVEIARARDSGAEFFCGSVDALPFADETFDRVLSLDVLTHAGVDEKKTMTEMHRVLRANGKLILNLAAFDFLKGAHDLAVNVDRRYKRGQIETLLRTANFTIERATYWNALFLPPIAFFRWFGRHRFAQKSPRSDFRSLPNFVNTALRGIARLELLTSRHLSLPFGTSLFVVARKNA